MKDILTLYKTGGTQEQRNLAWIFLGVFILTMPTGLPDTFGGHILLGNIMVFLGMAMIVKGFSVKFKFPARFGKFLLLLIITLGASGAGIFVEQVIIHVQEPISKMECRDDVAVATWGGGMWLKQGLNPYEHYNYLETRNLCQKPLLVGGTVIRQGSFATSALMPSDKDIAAINNKSLTNINQPEIEKNFNYPAGGFIVGVFGTGVVFALSIILYLLTLGVMLKKVKSSWRILLFFGYTMQFAAITTIANGRMDSTAMSLHVLAWLNIDNPLGALLLGLAAGTKQTVWFFIPAFIGIVWARESFRTAIKRSLVVAGGFLLLNLPFMVLNASAWFKGVLGPMLDGLFPLGFGPIAYVNSYHLPMFLITLLNISMYALVLAALPLALKFEKKYPGLVVLCGGLALWIGPRSLLEYVAPLPFLVIASYIKSQSYRSKLAEDTSVPINE